MIKALKHIIPSYLKNIIRKIFIHETKQGWFGNYNSWEDALKNSRGYDDELILKKVLESTLAVKQGEAAYERDSVIFKDHEYSEDLLKAFKNTILNNELSIIDFGGALGSTYFQYKRFFKDINLNWSVIEQPHYVRNGNKYIANSELHFFNSIEDALKHKKANVIILSCVLPYLEKPYDWINLIQSFNFDWIIIDRNPFIPSNEDLLTVQYVPESIYKASYPAWFFSESRFLNAIKDRYKINCNFVSPFTQATEVLTKKAVWKGFLLEKIR